MARMNDKVALVVGGARGIGLAIARALTDEGALVTLTGRRAAEVASAAETLGATGIVADAGAPDDLVRVVEQVRATHYRIDALVLNAGLSEPALLSEETPEHFFVISASTLAARCSASGRRCPLCPTAHRWSWWGRSPM